MHNAAFAEGSGSILLDNLMCEGHESSLLDCVASEDIGTHNCEHSEDAGVRCEGKFLCRSTYCTSVIPVLYTVMFCNHRET